MGKKLPLPKKHFQREKLRQFNLIVGMGVEAGNKGKSYSNINPQFG